VDLGKTLPISPDNFEEVRAAQYGKQMGMK
jgi:hypothetical protein